MSFLRKIKKFLEKIDTGGTLLLPAIVESREILLILERTSDSHFRVIVIQTDPFGGLRHHAVSPDAGPPKIKYRSCMVLNMVPKRNALDDVFWTALYNLCIHNHKGDTNRFYDILVPFMTDKPLESSLVEAEEFAEGKENKEKSGDWSSPQRSKTAYVRCVLHALRYLLISR